MRRTVFVSAALPLLLLGCDERKDTSRSARVVVAESPGTAECAVCSMVVREQPAPRAQVVHRDGARRFLCSLGDLVQYLRAPSRHGKVEAVFVEVLDSTQDPTRVSAEPRPWVRWEAAHFVVGVARSGVMGVPVLAYRDSDDARRIARAHQARVVRYGRLASAAKRGRRAH